MLLEFCLKEYDLFQHLKQYLDFVSLYNLCFVSSLTLQILGTLVLSCRLSVWDQNAIKLTRSKIVVPSEDFNFKSAVSPILLENGLFVQPIFNKKRRTSIIKITSREYKHIFRFVEAGSIPYHYFGHLFSLLNVPASLSSNKRNQTFLIGNTFNHRMGNSVYHLRNIIDVSDVFHPSIKCIHNQQFHYSLSLNERGLHFVKELIKHDGHSSWRGDYCWHSDWSRRLSYCLIKNEYGEFGHKDFSSRRTCIGLVDDFVICLNSSDSSVDVENIINSQQYFTVNLLDFGIQDDFSQLCLESGLLVFSDCGPTMKFVLINVHNKTTQLFEMPFKFDQMRYGGNFVLKLRCTDRIEKTFRSFDLTSTCLI